MGMARTHMANSPILILSRSKDATPLAPCSIGVWHAHRASFDRLRMRMSGAWQRHLHTMAGI